MSQNSEGFHFPLVSQSLTEHSIPYAPEPVLGMQSWGAVACILLVVGWDPGLGLQRKGRLCLTGGESRRVSAGGGI